MKYLQTYENYEIDETLSKLKSFLYDFGFDFYDGEDFFDEQYDEIVNDSSLSKEEKAKKLTSCLEEHWGLYDGWQDTLEFITQIL